MRTESFLGSGWHGMALSSSPANVRSIIGIVKTEFPELPLTWMAPLVAESRQEEVKAEVLAHIGAVPWNFLPA